jgi:dynein heavy chain 2, cytosolic
MSKLEADPKVVSLADAAVFPNLRERLVTMVDQLERCQRALSDFLEERRSKFPRFYFIGGERGQEALACSVQKRPRTPLYHPL